MPRIAVSRNNILGQTKAITITCLDDNGANTDPTAITVTVRNPATGAETNYTYPGAGFTKTATGVILFKHTPTAEHPAPWEYRIVADTAGAGAAAIAQVYVEPDVFTG